MNGKYLLVANLLAMMVLLLTLVPASTQQEAPYDPWIDTNEDGTIDIFDLISMARIYGASGDPTKNVNVTNWPSGYQVQKVSLNFSWTNYHGFASTQPIVCAGGYSRITLSFNPTNMSARANEVTVSAYFVDWFTGLTPPTWAYANDYIPSGLFVATAYRVGPGLGVTGDTSILETKAPYFDFRFNCTSPDYSGWATFDALYYLRNE